MKPIVIDLFCGAGGESQGIHWAAEKSGIEIELHAVNHWKTAVESHSLNFPADECLCKSIEDVDPRKVVPGRKVALLWGSPECTHFSNARGGKPCDDQSRCTPFDILRWLDILTVDRVIIENVPEFQSWGPLGDNDRPIQEAKGSMFNSFVSMIRAMGYHVDWRVLNAADFGAPTTRRRLFIQAVRYGCGKQLLWPQPSHVSAENRDVFSGDMPSWVPARNIIDWSIPSVPLELRTRPLAPNTMKRIMQGIEKYWGESAKPFITRYNGGENRNHDLDEPMPVLDTSNRYALVEPFIFNIGQTGSNRRPRSINEPITTVVTKAEHCLVEPLVVKLSHNENCESINNPLSTVRTSGAHHGLIEPLLMEYYGNGKCKPVSNPVGVVTTKERFAMIEPRNVSIGFRMLQPHELSAAQSFPKTYQFTGNRSDVVKQIGNAVCPKVAEALVGGMW